jgi:hypothetical protein
MKTTCQICGRAIKAKTGLIAHHGYRRPHQGWQTRSCFGARYRPYEVACDALPGAIEQVEKFIANQTDALAKLYSDPPAKLDITRRHRGRPIGPEQFAERPADFDPAKIPAAFKWDQKYEQAWSSAKHALERAIKGAGLDLEYLKKRLADWRAPVENVALAP